ncbi:MAG: GNAT family N-acetyltransferase [Nitriliruptoraceae bacterium]
MRELADADVDAALALWARTEHLGPTPREELEQLRAHDPGLVLVAVDAAGTASTSKQPAEGTGGGLAGVVLGSFDGRRGWISRLAVAPDARRRGIGRALVAEVERRLAARGCRQVNLLTFEDNRAGRAMWAALGYRCLEQVVLYSRTIADSDATAADDAEPGC